MEIWKLKRRKIIKTKINKEYEKFLSQINYLKTKINKQDKILLSEINYLKTKS